MADERPTAPPPPPPLPAELQPPLAVVRPKRPPNLLPWLIPALALLLVGIVIAQSLGARGPWITLVFDEGHGLKAGDPIVHRGVQVGRVREVGLEPGTSRIRVRAELARDARFLTRGGRFWIVRPEVSLSRVSGLETLLGPRYIAADIAPEGHRSPGVTALESPPTQQDLPGLNIIIRAARAGSLGPGSPISCRELPVGSVTGVTLAPDGRSVLIAANIQESYAHLVRPTTVFWNVSGIGLDVGLVGGLKLKAESLQTVLAGGLAFATPERPEPGDPVHSGHEFSLADYSDAYLRWSPDLTPPKP